MGKFDGYLILSDFDGTLIHDREISKENREAIKYFQENGGIFTIATGRRPEHFLNYKDIFVINAPIVSLNGTLVYDLERGKIICEYPLDNNYFVPIKYAALKYQEIRQIYAYSLTDAVIWSRGSADDINKLNILNGSKYYKIIFVMEDEKEVKIIEKDLIENFGDQYNFDRSWNKGVEMHIKGSGKGECIEIIKKYLITKNIKIHKTIGVGDYENDISLIQMSDIGYATENAIQELKDVADRIAPSSKENAIAYIIHDLEADITMRCR